MEMSWPGLLTDWLAEHWPIGWYNHAPTKNWLGFIRCGCHDRRAVARVEDDLIAIIGWRDPEVSAYPRYHTKPCERKVGSTGYCHCTETVINVADGLQFEQLAKLLDNMHVKRLINGGSNA
jgi:hypothetical protein